VIVSIFELLMKIKNKLHLLNYHFKITTSKVIFYFLFYSLDKFDGMYDGMYDGMFEFFLKKFMTTLRMTLGSI
jgi:hypothetical protein